MNHSKLHTYPIPHFGEGLGMGLLFYIFATDENLFRNTAK